MNLSAEEHAYRNRRNAHFKRIPPTILNNWQSLIIDSNLYSQGEDAVELFLTTRKTMNEDNLVRYAKHAEAEGYPDVACGFWRKAYEKHIRSLKPENSPQVEDAANSKDSDLVASFQEFWFALVRAQSNYSCYAIYWALPADKEAAQYLTDFGDDLDFISRPHVLVITLGMDQCLHVDIGGKKYLVDIKSNIAGFARLFGIDFVKFPCLIVFRNMKSPVGVPVSIKSMTAEQIFETMRVVFSIIQDAAAKSKSPLEALQQHQHDQRLRHAGMFIVGAVQGFVKFSYKTILETLTTHYAPKAPL